MFQVNQVKPVGITLTNGEVARTSPDQPPKFQDSERTQVLDGNWYHDGFFNNGEDVEYTPFKYQPKDYCWEEYSPPSADLSKTAMVSGSYSAWALMREGLRPFKNQMFPRRIFDQNNGEEIDPYIQLPGKVRNVR